MQKTKKITAIKSSSIAVLAVLLAGIHLALPAWAVDRSQCVPMTTPTRGLYATPYRHAITLTKDGKMMELKEGEAAYGNEQGLTCLADRPAFLEQDLVPKASVLGAAAASCGINFDQTLLTESAEFLHWKYPIASVILHGLSNGHTIDEAVFAAITAEPQRAQEIYDTALSMLPSLPGWACGSDDNQVDYYATYQVTDLPDKRTVEEVSKRYFKDHKELQPFPDWPGGDFHMLAPVAELQKLVTDDFWYRPGPEQDLPGANPRDAIMVALYDNGNKIVVDSSADKLQRLQQLGVNKAPVVFFYNRENQRPISEFGADVKLDDVIDAYFNKGIQLTHPPLWQVGDHTMMVDISELEELFDVPSRGEIGDEAYAKIVERLKKDGFKRSPIMVTLFGDTNGKFLAEASRVRAAADLGMTSVPTVVFYHSLDRLPCGAPANCVQRLCSAATCAGADQSVCTPGGICATGVAPFVPPGGGGGGGEPPPPPPPPPTMPPPSGPPSPGGPPR